MAESLSEVSSSMEGLEGTEEGKKKSKFKAFRNFFGKKKKKELEDVVEVRGLKTRFSSSSVKPVLEVQVVENKPKSSMGNKAISHDSVFCLEPEPEKPASKLLSSPKDKRSRSRKKSSISRILPRISGTDVLGALSGSVRRYDTKSELWVSGSKVAETPSPRSRKLSISPSAIRSEKVSKDLETADDNTPTSSKGISSSHCSSTTRKSTSELSSDLDISSQSSTQQISGFSTPATSQGCLDSSAAKHKIAVKPRKQKRKKTMSLSAKAKHEEQHAAMETKEKATTKTKQADGKEKKRDPTGPPSQDQSNKTETQDKKTRDQTLSTDAASSTGHSTSESFPRRRRRRVKNELGIIEKSLVKSTQERDRGSKAEPSPSEELAGREHSILKRYLEKQGTEQITTAEGPTPREMPADKRDVKGKMADRDVETRRSPAPRPTDVAESRVSGPPPSREEGSSESKKKKDRDALLPQARRSSTSEEEATVSRAVEAQEHKHPPQVHGEEKEASKVGLQKLQPKMELSLESTSYHKERQPRGGLRVFPASASTVTTAGDASMQVLPLPLRRWPNAGTVSSDSKSTSEYESSSEVQPIPPHSFQLALNPQDDDDVFPKSENADAEVDKTEQKQPLGYSSQSSGKAKAREVLSVSDKSSEEPGSSEEMTSAQSSQSSEEYEECPESRSFILDSVSGEHLAPEKHPQTLQESEEKEFSTESSSYIDRYQSSEDLTSSDEEQSLESSKQARGQSREQQEVSPVLKSVPNESSVSAMPMHPIHTSPPTVSPITQQQPPVSVNISAGQSKPVQPLSPSHTIKSWGSSQSEHQVFADPEGVPDDWNIFIQPPSPIKASKHPVGYNVEQNVSSSPDISTMEEVASMESLLLRHHSQPPVRPVLEPCPCAGPESAVFEEGVAAQPPRYPSQSLMRPSMKKELPLGAESAAFEGSHFLEPLPPVSMEPLPAQTPMQPFMQHQASAFERGVSMDPRLMAHSFQPWINPPGKQSFSTPESTALEGNTSMEHVPPTLPQPMQQPYQNVPLESEAVAAKVISMGPLHTQYSAQLLLNPQSQLFSESASAQGTTLAELLPPQPSVKTKFQPQMTRDPASTSTQWGSPMDPTSAQHIFQTQASPKFKKVLTGSDSPEAQGDISKQPDSPRCPSQPWLTPTFEQMSVPPGNVPAAWSIPFYPPAPRMPSQPSMGSVVQQPVSTGSMNTSVQQISSIEPTSPRHPLQSWSPSPFEQVSVPPDSAATPAWGMPIEPPAPRMLSQPSMGSVVQQPVSPEIVGMSVPQSSTMELTPSRFPFQPRVDPEIYGAEEDVSVMMRPGRHHSKPPISAGFKEDVSPDSMRASGEWGIPIESMPSKYAPQSWLGPEFEQQTSSLEGVAQEGSISQEAWLSKNLSQAIIKPQVQKTPSSFESTSMEGGVPWMPQPPKAPTSFLTGSNVQEMPSHLESAVAQESAKKAQDSRASSQLLMKFMTEQMFSESTASETDIYAKPTLRSRSRPSRSLLKPKLEEQAFLYNWDDEPKGDTALKNVPVKQPSQSPRGPEEPQDVLSYSEGTPMKWSSAAVGVSQLLGKLERRQKVSTSVSFPEEWKRSEGQLPSTQPSQAFDVAGLQPPMFSTGSANVEWSCPEEHQPPGQSTQGFLMSDYQQQVYLSSVNAAAEGTISQKNTDSWPMPEHPDSPKKTMKYTQGYGDFTKSTSTSITKPSKFTTVPAQKAVVSTGAYSTEGIPQCRDDGDSPSSTKVDVENVFGVRLRRISQKSGMENPDPFMPDITANKEQMNKGAPQAVSGGLEKLSQAVSIAEKQGSSSKYEGTSKKPAVYRPPEKTASLKADSTPEPTWINVAKQRQKGFVSQFPKTSRVRAEIKAEIKESRYESKHDPDSEIPPKEHEPITDALPRMNFSPNIPRQEMSKMSKSTKAVVFDDPNMLHPHGKERETRRSSSLPSKFPPPEEPVWFSMAKKKAKAWSQMADNIQ
ncbi:acrosomal protein KIAA1210 homolog [Mesocricetus auratus]|uniref:Acrosomal protein KIAA1210 homolog n=1 Tax=Mesocricetus auratus TaxID=10036 RepID=A0ABM2XHS5_MESAU|nr:acrosomal protein KIAA1210 homolog [Mesocricetus auratus]